MKTKKTALIVIVSMLIFSIFIANIANVINDDLNLHHRKVISTKLTTPIDDQNKHLVWFLQISDIHISLFRDPSRITEFREFCHQTVDVIQPMVVLASGDLTDAITPDKIGSRQYKKEWQHYQNILKDTQVAKRTVWLDIRGNHDNFNVASLESPENYFLNYSVQGGVHPRSYLHQIHKSGNLYSFIGVDACLEPGPRRPFNFVGMLDKPELDKINSIVKQVENSRSDYTVWFGHYPTSCILTTNGEGVRSLFRKLNQTMVYVCGHLHTLGGYRLLAIDHGFVSFIDVQHREWPIVLVTNPKHALFMIPNKENPEYILNSTHIRVLAFSISNIKTVKINVGERGWEAATYVQGPLYVLKWEPHEFSQGVHNIQVFVKDEEGREKIISQPFSLDNSRLSFDLLPRIALMTDASSVFKYMFISLLMCTIFPLILFRVIHKMVTNNRMSKPTIPRGFFKRWIRKFWILSTVDRIFWPLVLYPLYLSFGPWSVGHIIEDHIGVIFAWGIFVNGTFLPGSFTYAYGFLQLLTFQIPITFILANGVFHRFQLNVTKPLKLKTTWGIIALHLPISILLTLQIILAYFFWLAYGTLAFILGPLRTWSVVLAIVLWLQAINLPLKCTQEAAYVWYVKSENHLSQTDISLNSAT